MKRREQLQMESKWVYKLLFMKYLTELKLNHNIIYVDTDSIKESNGKWQTKNDNM